MKLVDMRYKSATEIKKVLDSERPQPKIRRFIEQTYTVTAYWRCGDTKSYKDVGKVVANRLVAQMRMEGAYRVDRIETETLVNEEVGKEIETRTIAFRKQTFEAANNKFVPNPIKQEENPQLHLKMGWPENPNIADAFLSDRPIVKVAWRNAIQRSKDKANARFQKLNPPTIRDGWKLFDRATGNFLFSDFDEMEVVKYIKSNNRTLENTIMYVPENVFQELKRMEN